MLCASVRSHALPALVGADHKPHVSFNGLFDGDVSASLLGYHRNDPESIFATSPQFGNSTTSASATIQAGSPASKPSKS